jgi:hypothetical protein
VEDGAEWVIRGEGIATQKFDGTCCIIKGGVLYKRLRAKKQSPSDFIHWSFDPEQRTGHGWVPVKDIPEDHMHNSVDISGLNDGTYELCGERVNRNREKIKGYNLLKHGSVVFKDAPVGYEELKEWLKDKDIEGLVWHHPNGDMIKIKKSDFGMNRK